MNPNPMIRHTSAWFAACLILSLVLASAAALGQTVPDDRLAAAPLTEAAGKLTMNFNAVPLDTVLDYLSRAAGFIVIKKVAVQGSVSVVSKQPLTADEAAALLDTALQEQGFAAIRNGRTLKIVTLDEARTRSIPVRVGNDPETMAGGDQMATQIIPVRHANAAQLLENLRGLLPEWVTVTANESSNAIVLTDTQNDIRRTAEIVRALDQAISSITELHIYRLTHADAKDTAALITQLFAPAAQSGAANTNPQPPVMFGAPGDPFGGQTGAPADNQSGDASTTSAARKAYSTVSAVADERTNSLVVSAPGETIPTIEALIDQIDHSANLPMTVRIFTLKHADATQMAQSLQNIFTQQTQTVVAGAAGPGGGPNFGAFPVANLNADGDDLSARQRAASSIQIIADTRTNSIIVSAVDAVMKNVALVVAKLDNNSAGTKRVQVYKLKGGNAQQVATTLQGMFGANAKAAVGSSATNQRAGNAATAASGNQGGQGNAASGTGSGAGPNSGINIGF